MKIVVFSDSHGRTSSMCDVVLALRPDAVLHLGDCTDDLDEVKQIYPGAVYHAVQGNCDMLSGAPVREETVLGGVRILMTHGHLYRVKYGPEPLRNAGVLTKAQLVLYGHTHTPGWEYQCDRFFLNPGSIGYGDSYAVIEANEGKFTFSLCRTDDMGKNLLRNKSENR